MVYLQIASLFVFFLIVCFLKIPLGISIPLSTNKFIGHPIYKCGHGQNMSSSQYGYKTH